MVLFKNMQKMNKALLGFSSDIKLSLKQNIHKYLNQLRFITLFLNGHLNKSNIFRFFPEYYIVRINLNMLL